MPPPDAEFLERAWSALASASARANVAAVIGTERVVDSEVRISALVIDAGGVRSGFQDKVQLDPSEEPFFTAGTGRRLFRVVPPDVRARGPCLDLRRGAESGRLVQL